jgi:hypothetical protein
MRSRTPLRRPSQIAAVAVLCAMLAGCSFITPQETKGMPETSIGRNFRVGDVMVGNIVLVTDDGQVGNVVGTLVNLGSRTTRLTITSDRGDSFTVTLDPNVFVQVGRPGGVIDFVDIASPAGSLSDTLFRVEDGSERTVAVPVLDDSLPQLEGLSPEVLEEPARPTGTQAP